MTEEKSQLESNFKTKFHLVFWAIFFTLLGGFLGTLALAVVSFLIALFFLDSKGIGLGIFLFPYVLVSSSLLSSYKFFSSNSADKRRLNRNYSILVRLIILAFGAYYLFNFSVKQVIRPRYSNFAKALHEDDYPTAFSFMSPAYRGTISLKDFEEEFHYLYVGDQYENWPPLWTIDIQDFGRKAVINYNARSYLDFERTGSTFLFLEKIDGNWYFTGEIAWGGG
jgi:hypothetical protein